MKLLRKEGGEEGDRTFRGVQALRGLAAVMVVALHATQYWGQRVGGGATALVWGNGAAGVDIFFVISGFVMAVSTIGREDPRHPARVFLQRRIIRIAPLYWVATVLVLLKVLILSRHPEFANAEEHAKTTLSYIASSFLFVPYRNSLGRVEPLLILGWTLSFEMFFYLLFATALALRVRVTPWLTAVMAGLVLGGVLARLFLGQHLPAVATLASPLLLEFLAGLLVGQAIISGYRLNVWLYVVPGVLGLAMLLIKPWILEPRIRVLGWGLPAALVVAAVVAAERRYGHIWPQWTLTLGNASYSLYLFHLLILGVAAKGLSKTSVVLPGRVRRADEFAVVVIVLCVCVPCALLIYRFVERPMTRMLRRLVGRRSNNPDGQLPNGEVRMTIDA